MLVGIPVFQLSIRVFRLHIQISETKIKKSGIATSAPFLSHLAFHSYDTRSLGQQCMMSSSQWYNYSEVCSRVLQEVQQQPSGLLSPDEGGLQLEKPDSPSAQAEGEKKDDLNTVSLSGVRRKLYVVMVVIVSELQEWSALDNTVKDIQASVEELAAGGDEEGGEDGKEEAAKKTHGLDSESESEEDEEGEG